MNPTGLFGSNPFAALSLIAAPAVLTNATSVLVLGTSNRFARAIDRARTLAKDLEGKAVSGDPMTLLRVRQLNRLEHRSILLLRALRSFYTALASFASAGLISLVGASLATSAHHITFRITLGLATLTGVVGVGGIVLGCILLVDDTRLAVLNVREEAAIVRDRFKDYLAADEKAGDPG